MCLFAPGVVHWRVGRSNIFASCGFNCIYPEVKLQPQASLTSTYCSLCVSVSYWDNVLLLWSVIGGENDLSCSYEEILELQIKAFFFPFFLSITLLELINWIVVLVSIVSHLMKRKNELKILIKLPERSFVCSGCSLRLENYFQTIYSSNRLHRFYKITKGW